MNALLNVSNIYWTYPDGTVGLKDVSFKIFEGESLGIIGPNGAGKTTLVNALNGIYIPESGFVELGGVRVSKKTRDQIRQRLGVVFQNADDQLFMPVISEDLAFGPVNMGLSMDEVEKNVYEVLKLLDISKIRNKAPYNLSAGQKRFAAIGTVIIMKPDLLVFDEPTSDLDPKNRRKLIELLKRINSAKIIISHDLDFIWDTCKRTILIDNGRVSADGETRIILSNEELLQSSGLELPLRLQNIY